MPGMRNCRNGGAIGILGGGDNLACDRKIKAHSKITSAPIGALKLKFPHFWKL